MNQNAFLLGLQRSPQKFFDSLTSQELGAVAEACVRLLERRAKQGDKGAAPALQALYRQIANVEM